MVAIFRIQTATFCPVREAVRSACVWSGIPTDFSSESLILQLPCETDRENKYAKLVSTLNSQQTNPGACEMAQQVGVLAWQA